MSEKRQVTQGPSSPQAVYVGGYTGTELLATMPRQMPQTPTESRAGERKEGLGVLSDAGRGTGLEHTSSPMADASQGPSRPKRRSLCAQNPRQHTYLSGTRESSTCLSPCEQSTSLSR